MSLRQIARQAGVSVYTVSKALRGPTGVNQETRKRILTIAKKLGYVRDPSLSNALAYARRPDKPIYRETLAFLADLPQDRYASMPWLKEICDGASQRARELGYTLDCFSYPSTERDQQALSRQILARGIRGLIISPGITTIPFHLKFDWSKFAAVEIGQTLVDSKLTNITRDSVEDFHAMFVELLIRGYKRIGLAVSNREEMRHGWVILSAYLTFQYRHPKITHLPPLSNFSSSNLEKWLKRSRPDVVVTNGQWLQTGPYKLDNSIDVCRIDAFGGTDSGLRPDYSNMGWTAVNALALNLQHREIHITTRSQSITIPNAWREGSCLRFRPLDSPAMPLSLHEQSN
ncbi:LacI family DNA-binding transcriptional regulator [Terrimicrobium sacchariphilum]|uniref:LacI family DNA-binding transcriptional regulator n=1 Tax=Terrimicrobium sacchariphilum TaxID=690879 RepID=UPI001470F3E2|nr:LacI family DNA-binding transcriptional regulator [Terrimicrobium sacchariphilum]